MTSQQIRTVVKPIRTSTRRRTTWPLCILAGLLLGVTAAGDAAGEPPEKLSPGDQKVAEMLKQILGKLPTEQTEANTESEPEQTAEVEQASEIEALDSSAVTVTDTGLLEVHVRDTSICTVLEMLSYQARSNIVTTKSVQGTISANLYGLTLHEALDAILIPNKFAYRQVNSTIFVGTAEEVAEQGPPPETQVFKLRFISKAEAANVVTSVLSKEGVALAGGEEEDSSSSSGSTDEVGETGVDYIIVTDIPARLDAVEELLAEIDVRPKQVLIEATILRATLNEDNQFGIDFSLLGGIDFQDVGSTSDTSTNITTGDTPNAKFEKTTFNVNTDLLSGMPSGGFTFGIIKNSVATFVRAMEDVTDVAVVANPKIIALNKQSAEVIVGRRDGYITTTVTETAAVQTVEFLETGTQISFRPIINEDGTVMLSVHPKDSNGGLTAANLPFEETTEAQASILVDDGRSVLIGGLFRERTLNSKGQIPILGDIPGAGLLFQHKSDTTVREEVIILLTVHVLKNTEEEYAQYAALLEDIERIRIGSRMGLLASGRERLAQAFYREAIRQTELGDDDLALLNTRMALHNYPEHMAAFKLKERLLGRRLWENSGSRTRLFLMDLIRQEQTSVEETDNSELFGRPPLDLQSIRQDGIGPQPEPEPVEEETP